MQYSHAIFVHKEVHARYGLVHDLLLPRNHARKINVQPTDFNAVGLKFLVGFEVMLRAVEQSFGGNAPHIEAGSAKGSALFDDLETALSDDFD